MIGLRPVGPRDSRSPARGDLSKALERLIAAYQPDRIYLFGWMDRGEAGSDSDYDLLIVFPDDSPAERKRSRLAYERLWGTGLAVDALVCTESWFEARRKLKASLPGSVFREGRLVYAA